MSRYSRRRWSDRTPPRPLPRGTTAAAVFAAAALASLALVAGARAATPAPEQPPAGAVLILVAVSDGTTYLPYGQAVVPPTACQP